MRSAIFSVVSSIVITLLMSGPGPAPAPVTVVEACAARVDSAADPEVHIHHLILNEHGQLYLSVDSIPCALVAAHDPASCSRLCISTVQCILGAAEDHVD